ncbi:hypothetical protein VitviT2T_007335 [Vitis vinifera]|uniref:Major facilitator superfamily (MFS) profile domain-containing protein n=1 Tax=Vitis vinifera TaxID=29760 RepID=A0ABY9BYW8_VITVI|nr:hypothetical protein VitviT2T_007335 [Vitis vinifera]
MVGAISSGWIADSIGRKRAMRMSSMVYIAGWITVYLSFGFVSFYSGRFLLGYGIGVLSYVIPVFIVEITPKNHRGTLATTNQVGPLAAYYKLPLNRMVVFHDDKSLPCGVLCLHHKGGHGSHNGTGLVIELEKLPIYDD